MRQLSPHKNGFTLLEMMLVLGLISIVVYMLIQYNSTRTTQASRERSVEQIQWILNTARQVYLTYNKWPLNSTACNGLASAERIGGVTPPPSFFVTNNIQIPSLANTYGNAINKTYYAIYCSASRGYNFIVEAYFPLTSIASATAIAGMLPLGRVTTTATEATVSAQISIPAQVLNNARTVNFGSLYHSGACVPVPKCVGGMVPQILLSAASVSGVATPPVNCTNPNDYTTCSYNSTSVSSYNVYAMGGAAGSAANSIQNCANTAVQPCTIDSPPQAGNTPNYWRVCLQVSSQNQQITVQNTQGMTPGSTGNCNTTDCQVAWGQALGNIMVTTRCQPPSENTGSDFSVWQQ